LINFVDATNDANHYTKPPPIKTIKTTKILFTKVFHLHFKVQVSLITLIHSIHCCNMLCINAGVQH